MNSRTKVSRAAVVGFVASLLVLAGLLAMRYGGWPRPTDPAQIIPALEAERAKLLIAIADRPRLLAEVEATRRDATGDEVQRWSAPVGWSLRLDPGQGQRATLVADRPAPSWAAIIETVRQLEHHAGWRMVGLDVRTGGSRHRRHIAAVEIVLEGPTATPGRPPDMRPAAVPVSPGEVSSAEPQKVGLVPSLRRPFDSADRQAARLRLPIRPPLRSDPTLRGAPAASINNQSINSPHHL
jgi:hypothetical protein